MDFKLNWHTNLIIDEKCLKYIYIFFIIIPSIYSLK